MAEYALVANADDKILRVLPSSRFRGGRPPVFVNNKPWRWLPVVRVERPTWDRATHKAPVATVEVQTNQVVYGWDDPVAYTAQELDDRQEGELPDELDLVFKVLFRHENRIRVLEGKNAITVPQFRTALKNLL